MGINFPKYFRYFRKTVRESLLFTIFSTYSEYFGDYFSEIFHIFWEILLLKYSEYFGKLVWSTSIKIFGIFWKNDPGFEQNRCLLDKESGKIYLLVYSLKFCPIFREFGDARSYELRPIVATSGVLFKALDEISSALLAPRMFFGRSRFRLRLQQLRMWIF